MDKIKVPINIGQGLDTKTDPKHVVPGKLTVLENGIFQKNGRIDKRKGYDALGQKTLDGTALPSGDGLAVFKDELLQYNNQEVYSYVQGVNSFVSKGSCASLIVSSKSIISNTASQSSVDSAYLSGLTLYAWEDSRGGVRASIFDEETKVPILSDVVIDASGSRVRCLAFKMFLYVFYYKSGELYARRISTANPQVFDTEVSIYDDINTTDPNYDVYNFLDTRILWTANRQSSAGVKAGWTDDQLAGLTGALSPQTISTEAATESLSIVKGPTTLFYFLYHNTTDGVRSVLTNNGLTILNSGVDVENITASNVVNITGFSTTTGITVFYEVEAASTYNQVIRQNTLTTSNVAGTPTDFKRSVGLWTKAFSLTGTDEVTRSYVGVVHESTLQSTYFIVRDDGLIVAKQQYTLASQLTSYPILQNVSTLAAGVFIYALLKKNRIISENATLFSQVGISQTKADFTSEDIFQAVELGKNLHIAGGILNMYDGESVVEHGFHLYPENVSLGQSASGGSMSNGTYQVQVVYEWTDNQGQRHRSAPSVASSIVLSGGGSSQKITATIPTLRLTAKDGTTRTNIVLAVYRTVNLGDIFYRATSITSPNYNLTTSDSVAVDLTINDTDLISREIIYTTGGVLDNFGPPSCSTIEVYKGRLWLGGLEEENLIYYSKELVSGEPAEFSDVLFKVVEPEGGKVTALKVLDDKILVFKRDRYYYTFGDGPNNLGQLGDFAELQFVTSDAGSISGVGLVRSPIGVLFKSQKGIYLLQSNLQATYVGDMVEDFNNLTVTSGQVVAVSNQIRFTTLNGPVLVYDYYFNQWSTFTGLESKSSVIWQSKYVILTESGKVLVENQNKWLDDDQSYTMKFVTGWLGVDGVSGFQRVSRLYLNGDYKSPHMVRVKIGYDFKESYEQSIEFDSTSKLTLSAYGDSSPYGSEEYYGSLGKAWSFMLYLAKQKSSSIRISIEEMIVRTDMNTEQGFNLSDLMLLVGVKKKGSPLRDSQKIGLGG